ncbi:hypothetical protein GCM10007049_07950 [Echinicola pacifica]|uniref:Uncharacterized protein n=1 Tax=Echinicola pacifica TaxID=346377 RepID=A0A918PRD9_9BACT|nr:hypothetical protein [Echinicola pacifica]GGZ17699.1 hypothetical protein GCM10007049_07950 [Echinicola pacifica]
MKKVIICLYALLFFSAGQVFGQQGIGTDIPDNSSVLDIVSTDKGVLIPRVVLDNVTQDLDGITGQAAGLMVYNTGDGGLMAGFYFWNGLEWRALNDKTAIAPEIETLLCATASLEPGVFSAGTAYSGIMKINYTGGNGGTYQAGEPISSVGNTGLTATLKGGELEFGNGTLVFDVTGTPALDSPNGASFDISFGTLDIQSCTATVGESTSAKIDYLASIGSLYATNDNGREGYHRFLTSPDGKFSVRVFVPKNTALQNADIQIRSNTGPSVIMWNNHLGYQNGTMGNASNAFRLPQAMVWYGNVGNDSDNPDSGTNAAWGDADVYHIAPEQRNYMWTTSDTKELTTYILKFMMGAPQSNISANDSNIGETKATLYLTQINALE